MTIPNKERKTKEVVVQHAVFSSARTWETCECCGTTRIRHGSPLGIIAEGEEDSIHIGEPVWKRTGITRVPAAGTRLLLTVEMVEVLPKGTPPVEEIVGMQILK